MGQHEINDSKHAGHWINAMILSRQWCNPPMSFNSLKDQQIFFKYRHGRGQIQTSIKWTVPFIRPFAWPLFHYSCRARLETVGDCRYLSSFYILCLKLLSSRNHIPKRHFCLFWWLQESIAKVHCYHYSHRNVYYQHKNEMEYKYVSYIKRNQYSASVTGVT